MQVFISYAREDRIYLERLLRFLSVLEKRGIISVWYDSLSRLACGSRPRSTSASTGPISSLP